MSNFFLRIDQTKMLINEGQKYCSIAIICLENQFLVFLRVVVFSQVFLYTILSGATKKTGLSSIHISDDFGML